MDSFVHHPSDLALPFPSWHSVFFFSIISSNERERYCTVLKMHLLQIHGLTFGIGQLDNGIHRKERIQTRLSAFSAGEGLRP